MDKDAVDETTGEESEQALYQSLAGRLMALSAALAGADSVAAVLQRVVDATLAVVPGADFVSVTLRSVDGRFHTPVATDSLAEEIDKLQYRYGQGPCVECARPGGPGYAHSPDVLVDAQWPQFGPAAAVLGVRSVLAVQLLPDATPPRMSGALNIFSQHPGGLAVGEKNTALLLASCATVALARTETVTRAELQSAHLLKALESRDIIGQAKGILMQRRGITADAAFEILRQTSQDLNIRLVELARTLATRHHELDL